MSRQITVETHGEVTELRDNINLMVSNLRETTRAKDWLESNLTRLAGLMQGHRDLVEVADLILRELTPLVNAQYGAFFLADTEVDGEQAGSAWTRPPRLAFLAGYGLQGAATETPDVLAQGLARQAALEQKRILVEEAPPDYIVISSGLGKAAPANIVIIPILFEDKLLGIIELASFFRFSDVHLAFFDQFVNTIGVAINTIIANSRTEALLERVPAARDAAPGTLGRAAAPAGRAAALERGTRREGRAARVLVPVQVGVPGEHVARAAYAAQLAC